MLTYNFDRIFKARGIAQPFAYLKNAGFSDSIASRLKNNKVARLNLSTIERLCILFKCTPNELMEWKPDSTHSVDSDDPINSLQRKGLVVDMTTILNSIPLENLEEVSASIKDHVDSYTRKPTS